MKSRISRTDMAREIYNDRWDEVLVRKEEYNYGNGAFIAEEIAADECGGKYITVALNKRIFSLTLKESLILSSVIATELSYLSKGHNKILVVGIGNRDMTVDSLGVRTAELITPIDKDSYGEKSLAVMIPGIKCATGISTFVTVKALADAVNATMLIAVDSLAASAPSRLGSVVQISTLGIAPGSGLGNRDTRLDKETLGIPVISIGVPTVIATDVLIGEISGEITEDDRFYVALSESDAVIESSARIISSGIEKAFAELDNICN